MVGDEESINDNLWQMKVNHIHLIVKNRVKRIGINLKSAKDTDAVTILDIIFPKFLWEAGIDVQKDNGN